MIFHRDHGQQFHNRIELRNRTIIERTIRTASIAGGVVDYIACRVVGDIGGCVTGYIQAAV